MARMTTLSTHKRYNGSHVRKEVGVRDELLLHVVFKDDKERVYLSDPLRVGEFLVHVIYRRCKRRKYDRRFSATIAHELLLVSPYLISDDVRARVLRSNGVAEGSESDNVPVLCVLLMRDGYAHCVYGAVAVDRASGQDRCMAFLRSTADDKLLGALDEVQTPYGETGWDRVCARPLEEIMRRHAKANHEGGKNDHRG